MRGLLTLLTALLIVAVLPTLVAAYVGCQSDRGRTCEVVALVGLNLPDEG